VEETLSLPQAEEAITTVVDSEAEEVIDNDNFV
jgi:hypothetical protein